MDGTAIPDCDALITSEENIIIGAFSADCLIIFVADPVKRVVAIIHAGWRGVLQNIIAKLTGALKIDYGVNPADLIATISPCICFDCFDVGQDVADAFCKSGWDDNRFIKENKAPDKYNVNLSEIAFGQLKSSGLDCKKIELSGMCTYCMPDYFYSYRREGPVTGRMMGFIAL